MAQTSFDFNIHDLVGIRLINPTEGDIAAVAKQLGPMCGPVTGTPDITIRFERQLSLANLRLLGLDNAGFTDNGYYILYNKKAPAKVRIPFDQIAGPCEILCESGLRAVPLLIAILNLTLLKKGYVPLHASAFVYEGTGILTTGWSKGGKTEAMLSFTHNGAQYVGDEWVILAKDGSKMFGLPEPITTWDWHLKDLPRFRAKVKPGKLRFFRAIRALERWSQNGLLKRSFLGSALNTAMPALKRQLNVNLPPERLFGIRGTDLVAKLDKVFFVMSHASPQIAVYETEPDEIAARMVASLEYELQPIREHYYAYKFAFPGQRNNVIENASQLQYEILSSALRGKEAYTVLHPYPVSLSELHKKMRPYCNGNPKDAERSKSPEIRSRKIPEAEACSA